MTVCVPEPFQGGGGPKIFYFPRIRNKKASFYTLNGIHIWVFSIQKVWTRGSFTWTCSCSINSGWIIFHIFIYFLNLFFGYFISSIFHEYLPSQNIDQDFLVFFRRCIFFSCLIYFSNGSFLSLEYLSNWCSRNSLNEWIFWQHIKIIFILILATFLFIVH